MRPLSEEELKQFLEKVGRYIGNNVRHLVERDDEPHVFRLHNDRVYYVGENLLKKAGCVARKNLAMVGVCFGKFTHTKKFHLHVTCLDFLARLAKYKVWLKPNGEQHFLYGNHIVRAHLRRIEGDMPRNAGVVVFSEQGNIPLGFGSAARSSTECRDAPAEAIVLYRQADIGEYLREEVNLL